MKVRVYTDYSPIRVLRGVSKNEFIEPTDFLANKLGLTGSFIEVDESSIPSDRKERDAWIQDPQTKKIIADKNKISEKKAREELMKQKKAAVLAKLNITELELAEIIG